jgi:hypothetical protein
MPNSAPMRSIVSALGRNRWTQRIAPSAAISRSMSSSRSADRDSTIPSSRCTRIDAVGSRGSIAIEAQHTPAAAARDPPAD